MVSYRLALVTLVALASGPTALLAQTPDFDGVWRSDPDTACEAAGGDSAPIRIADGVLHGVETECRMTDPQEVRDMEAVLYDMECAAEDDSSFTARAMFLKAADGGLYLIWDGYAFKYEPCDDGAAVSTAEKNEGETPPEPE